MGPKILLSHQSLKMRLWYIYRVSHMDGHEIRRILSTFMCDHFFLIRRVKNLSYYIGVSKQEKMAILSTTQLLVYPYRRPCTYILQAVYSNRHYQVKEISKPYIRKKPPFLQCYCIVPPSNLPDFFPKQYLRKLIQYQFQIAYGKKKCYTSLY